VKQPQFPGDVTVASARRHPYHNCLALDQSKVDSKPLPAVSGLDKQIKKTPNTALFTLTPLYTMATLDRHSKNPVQETKSAKRKALISDASPI
jgi:hypothetical protein